MGMIEAWMKKCPEGRRMEDFYKEVNANLPDHAEGADDYTIEIVNEKDFEDRWDRQENLRRNSDVYTRYKALARHGKVIFVEIDW
jgi:hypothetical protein